MSTGGLFDSPAAGFDAPFDLLDACHGRVRRMLALLQRLQAHLAAQGADEQASHAARDVRRYFDLAAPAHHEDEERHVFPALLHADPARWGPVVARLREDHAQMADEWQRSREALAGVAAGRWDPATQTQALSWARFAALYAGHLVTEDDAVFPAAIALLDPPALAAMGAEMAGRRGVGDPTR